MGCYGMLYHSLARSPSGRGLEKSNCTNLASPGTHLLPPHNTLSPLRLPNPLSHHLPLQLRRIPAPRPHCPRGRARSQSKHKILSAPILQANRRRPLGPIPPHPSRRRLLHDEPDPDGIRPARICRHHPRSVRVQRPPALARANGGVHTPACRGGVVRRQVYQRGGRGSPQGRRCGIREEESVIIHAGNLRTRNPIFIYPIQDYIFGTPLHTNHGHPLERQKQNRCGLPLIHSSIKIPLPDCLSVCLLSLKYLTYHTHLS